MTARPQPGPTAIRRLRDEVGISQEAMARELAGAGFCRATVSEYARAERRERSTLELDCAITLTLGRLLGRRVSIWEVIGAEDAPHQEAPPRATPRTRARQGGYPR